MLAGTFSLRRRRLELADVPDVPDAEDIADPAEAELAMDTVDASEPVDDCDPFCLRASFSSLRMSSTWAAM